MTESDRLRDLPAVHELLDRLAAATERYPRALVTNEIRRVLDARRADIAAGRPNGTPVEPQVLAGLAALERPSLRRVINASGVVLHTNLGRAPLGPFTLIPGYSNLEYDLPAGRRGKRNIHTATLLHRLLGAPSIVVNNNAAAVFLALHELASGGEVIVSRGELIEIGDGFRIPEIMARSGAVLREVGTTNRTRADDYRAAINERTRLLLRVHPSNFRISGFTARTSLAELVAVGREHNIPVYEDLGSGCLVDLAAFGVDEPVVKASLEAGADLVSFSGDKLLGGPQAGILAGKAEIVKRLERNPLFRALRVDKMSYQALESTLRNILLERWDEIPALAMIRQSAGEIRARAEAMLSKAPHLRAAIVAGSSVIGGGATPEQSIDSWLIEIACPAPVRAERSLRERDPAIVARIADDKLIFDLRTVLREEEAELLEALRGLTD